MVPDKKLVVKPTNGITLEPTNLSDVNTNFQRAVTGRECFRFRLSFPLDQNC